MEKKVILAIVVTLAIVVGIGAVFVSPAIVSDYNQLDLESPSTTMTPVPINDNAQQEALQKIANENYEKTIARMLNILPPTFKVSDFCSTLIVSEDIVQGKKSTDLTSETGFYVGPVLFFNENGEKVCQIDIVVVASKSPIYSFPEEYKDCTIVTLDKIDPEIAKNYRYFRPE